MLGLTMSSQYNCYAKDTEKFVVVLDPGHGGKDIGTPHRLYKKDEKTIALDVALRVGKLIEANHPDVKVVYTRKKDTYPTLTERTQIAKKAQGDLFISIHVNAADDKAAYGFETYIFGVTGLRGKSADEQKRIQARMVNEKENLDASGKPIDFEKDMDIETKILCQAQREKNNIYSEEAAKYVHSSIISGLKRTSYKANVKDREIRPQNIFVLCYAPMPSVLVELGYMSNPAEEKFITSQEGISCFSNAIYNGFVKYKNAWSKRKLNDVEEFTIAIEEKKPARAAKTTATTQNNKNAATKPAEKKVDPQPVVTPAPAPKKVEEKPAEKKVEAKPVAKKTEEQPVKKTDAKTSSTKFYYKIQFLISKRLIAEGAAEFKGLSPVDSYQDDGYYKYTYGKSDSPAGLTADLVKVRKLFHDAHIIIIDASGKRIK